MGSEAFTIDNGLYGFKGDLMDDLRNGTVPGWLYPGTPKTTADDRLNRDADADEFLEACVEAARGKNENFRFVNRNFSYAEFRVFFSKNTRTSGPSGTLQMRRPTLAPERIRERIREWLDDNEDRIFREEAYAEFRRGPRLRVSLGRRGGISDVTLEMKYGN